VRFNGLKFISTIFAVFAIFIVGCEENDDSESDGYTITTVDHFNGFDFSENIAQDSDGAVIGWQPGGGIHPNYNNDGDYLWWITRSIITGETTNKTKEMGTVALSSITEVPTNWEVSPNITPLLVGHVYVAKCIDGYVKFEVLSVSLSKDNWPVEIKYSFSSTSVFDN
jgi:hypothetical protein